MNRPTVAGVFVGDDQDGAEKAQTARAAEIAKSTRLIGVPVLAGAWRTLEVPDVAKLPPAKAGIPKLATERRIPDEDVACHRVAKLRRGDTRNETWTAKAEGLIWFALGLSALLALVVSLKGLF